jgi:simple sugar transport system permease protein
MRARRGWLAIVACIVVLVVLVAVRGTAAGPIAMALWRGSVGSWYAITSATLVRAVPLMLTGCAVAIAFRAGVFNIGAEGQLLAGAAGAAAMGLAIPGGGAVTIVLALLAGAIAGGCWAGLAAALRARFGVLEVISTIMLNFVALYGVSWLVRGPLQEPTHAYPQSSTLADPVHLWRIPGAGRLHAGLVVALVAVLACGWVMRHTAAGFRVLASGDSPTAAASAGLIDVRATTTRAFLVSGAFAGLAGAVEVLGVTFALYEDISPGYGYTAIAVALLAGLDPWKVVATAVLFAALEAGAGAMQRDAGVPSTVAAVAEAAMILIVLGLQAARAREGASA